MAFGQNLHVTCGAVAPAIGLSWSHARQQIKPVGHPASANQTFSLPTQHCDSLEVLTAYYFVFFVDKFFPLLLMCWISSPKTECWALNLFMWIAINHGENQYQAMGSCQGSSWICILSGKWVKDQSSTSFMNVDEYHLDYWPFRIAETYP